MNPHSRPPTDNVPRGIPGTTLRMMLDSIREVSGPQYEHILQQAGLDRYVRMPPVNGSTAACSADEASKLYEVIFRLLGEPVMRLFLRNYGKRLGAALEQHPAARELRAQVDAAKPEDKLEAAVRGIAKMSTRIWSAVEVSKQDGVLRLEVVSCLICAGITAASAPVCTSTELSYTALLQTALGKGRKLSVVEEQCHAHGAPRCVYRVNG